MMNPEMPSESPPAQNPWMFVPRPVGRPRLRLICLPHAGGNAAFFRDWSRLLPEEIELVAIQPPGRSSRLREPAFTSFDAMVEATCLALSPLLSKPFAIFGHSMGALVGFGLTLHLRRLGAPLPRHLFLSGFRAPHLPSRGVPRHDLPEGDFIAEIRRLNGTPRVVIENPDLMEILLPTLRADFALLASFYWKSEAPVDLPITAFAGDGDASQTPEMVAEWARHTTATFSMDVLSGDHFFHAQNRERICARMLSDLESSFDDAVGQV